MYFVVVYDIGIEFVFHLFILVRMHMHNMEEMSHSLWIPCLVCLLGFEIGAPQ